MSLTPAGRQAITGKSNLYPVFDPNFVFHNPRIGGYYPSFLAGRAFAIQYAVDGDGSQDRRIQNPRDLVLRVENGTATPAEVALRSKVVTYEVDRAPKFVTNSPAFRPRHLETFTTLEWQLNLVAHDSDPFPPGSAPGGPAGPPTLLRTIRLLGTDTEGNPVDRAYPGPYPDANVNIQAPSLLAPGPCVLEIELCDCANLEALSGSGRCVVQQFLVRYQPTGTNAEARPQARATPNSAEASILSPLVFSLASYPNPASTGATFRFLLPNAGRAELELFNLAGQRVRHLTSGDLPAGEHSWNWGGEDESGRLLPAGLYLVRLRVGENTLTRKVLVAP